MVDDADWLRFDAPFMENDLHGPRQGPSWLIETGRCPVMFSAVHGVVHHRPGRGAKSAEARTGGLARVLASSLETSLAVILRSSGEADANIDPDHPLKQTLRQRGLVGPHMAVIDLHGMTNEHSADVAIGWGPDPGLGGPLAELAIRAFEAFGFEVDPDGSRCGLSGAGTGTFTAFSQRQGAEAIQVEIARRNRTFLSEPDRRGRLLGAFGRLVAAVEAATSAPGAPLHRTGGEPGGQSG